MSAIFGIFMRDDGPVAPADLERMGATLRHRGPDGRKRLTDGPIGLGHCLMRVNREDVFEAQPLRDRSTGAAIVADCRIDNREYLAGRLGIAAEELERLPDSALILRAYGVWGEDCAERLVGDFAFAIWDGNAGKLVLGRDHMGQRNVFYHDGCGFFAFATEIKALWALADVPRELLDEEIARHFQRRGAERPEGRTRYAGISALPGGTIVSVATDRTVRVRRYWEPRPDAAHLGQDEAYYVDRYREVLTEAVACRLRRLTRPAALMMSAGFDTGAIAGLAGPVVAGQGRKLIGLSWLGAETGETSRGDIRPWLEACQRAMPHLDIRQLTAKRVDPLDNIERAFIVNEGPGGGARRSSIILFAEAARAGARLVMDGYGGDYTLNPRGLGALSHYLRRGQLRRLATEIAARSRLGGKSRWRVVKHDVLLGFLPPAFIRWQRSVRGIGSGAMLRAALRELEGPRLRLVRTRTGRTRPGPDTAPVMAIPERARLLADQVRRAPTAAAALSAAAHGLDLSRPFHDKRVVELGLAIPPDLQLRNGLNRYLARRALADIYPPEFQTRGEDNVGALGDEPILDLQAPGLVAEAGRMAVTPELADYFDLARAGQVLAESDSSPTGVARKHAAVTAIVTARFVEWFGGGNA